MINVTIQAVYRQKVVLKINENEKNLCIIKFGHSNGGIELL